MGSKTGNWEGLRKQARALENEIDLKLVSFSKLGTNYSRAATTNSDSDKQPLLGGAESGLESLESDLESLLSQLSAINDEMAGYAAGAGDARSAAIHHTLQRHSEILQVRPGLGGPHSSLSFMFCSGLQAGVQQDFQQHRQHVGEGGTAQLSPVGHFSLQERARGRQEESEDRQSSAGVGAHQVMLWAGRLSAGVK